MIEKTSAGPQYVLAGAARVGDAEIARRHANAPLRASKAQQPCDHGLFSVDAAQADLLHLIGRDWPFRESRRGRAGHMDARLIPQKLPNNPTGCA